MAVLSCQCTVTVEWTPSGLRVDRVDKWTHRLTDSHPVLSVRRRSRRVYLFSPRCSSIPGRRAQPGTRHAACGLGHAICNMQHATCAADPCKNMCKPCQQQHQAHVIITELRTMDSGLWTMVQAQALTVHCHVALKASIRARAGHGHGPRATGTQNNLVGKRSCNPSNQ